MSIIDKLKNKAQELKGEAKQVVGNVTGDQDLHAEGVIDEKSGQIKQVGENVKDVVR